MLEQRALSELKNEGRTLQMKKEKNATKEAIS
jgi:hypothetical protein